MSNLSTIEDVKDFVLQWNLRYPIDRWWREKHNVSFNSSVHRVSSFIDQLIEYEEDKLFRKIIREELDKVKDREEEKPNNEYIPGRGNFLDKKELTVEEANSTYNDLDIKDFKLD